MNTARAPELADLRAAYDRARLLRLAGYSFGRALASPLVRRGLELSAIARIRRGSWPYQVKLL